MKHIIGILLFACACQANTGVGREPLFMGGIVDAGASGPNSIEERTSKLTAASWQASTPFRDSLFVLANSGGVTGKIDGDVMVYTDGHVYGHVRFPGQPLLWAWESFDTQVTAYDTQCQAHTNTTWAGVGPFDVTTSVFFCGFDPYPNGGVQESHTNCIRSLGNQPKPSWGGLYSVLGDGDGTNIRHGLIGLNVTLNQWMILVRKTADTNPGGDFADVCDTGPVNGPGTVGQNMWLPILD